MTTKVKLIADGAITPDQITLTTASAGTNTVAPATTAFVQQEITALVDSSPAALNTLNELAAALGDDANFSTTVTNSIAAKAPLASPTFTGTVEIPNLTIGSNGNASGGNIQLGVDTNNANKYTAITSKAYASDAQPEGFITLASQAYDGGNDTFIGGGFGELDASTAVRFYTAASTNTATGTERLRIDSAGTLFQGTTSPTLHSAATGIVFENGSLLTDVTRGAGKAITLAQNAAVDSGNTWAYLATDEASYYQQFGGNHYFATAASGSAGADVTFDTKLFISNSGDVDMHGTGSLRLPNGTTAQRPTGANGMIRYNTTLAIVEEYRGGAWKSLSDAFSGSGGTKTTSGSYTYHTFTSSGAITFTGSGTVDILVVAGGAGGGTNSNQRGSGGGAGGLIFISGYPVDAGTYSAGVGSGGAEGASGTNSTFSGNGTTLTALGGGVGGNDDGTDNGADGGSGGGQWYPGYAGASATQPANTNDGSNTYNSTGFGNDGGTSGGTHPYGSGGGGAGGVGLNFNSSGGPVGGVGKDMSAIFGTSVGENGYFAGGGGSGSYPPVQDDKYVGGTGGGGRGWNGGTETEQNGTANTGGGGGAGGSGGSGIVILRYVT
jgi:hypothetical protein